MGSSIVSLVQEIFTEGHSHLHSPRRKMMPVISKLMQSITDFLREFRKSTEGRSHLHSPRRKMIPVISKLMQSITDFLRELGWTERLTPRAERAEALTGALTDNNMSLVNAVSQISLDGTDSAVKSIRSADMGQKFFSSLPDGVFNLLISFTTLNEFGNLHHVIRSNKKFYHRART